MALALDIVSVEKNQKNFRKIGLLTFSGNYSTGGDVVDLTAATSDAKIEGFQFRRNPIAAHVLKGAIAGYVLEVVKGTGLTDWKIKVYESGADGGDLDEIGAGAVPAAIAAADGDLYIEFIEKA